MMTEGNADNPNTFSGFDPVPSWRLMRDVELTVETADQADSSDGDVEVWGIPAGLADGQLTGVDPSWTVPIAVGFTGKVGQTLPGQLSDRTSTGVMMLFGIGDVAGADTAALRAAAAAYAKAVSGQSRLGLVIPTTPAVSPEKAAQVMVEGVLLGRYDPGLLKQDPGQTPITAIRIRLEADLDEAGVKAVLRGAQRGAVLARATALARDLANCPPSVLTATRMGEVATELGAECGVEVMVFDKAELIELGCGGLLGVNAGSADPPAMIKLRYQPEGAAKASLALVGKGIMYDSGGISLKPSDLVHSTMKNDMSGAGAILAAMMVLRELDCPNAVTSFLMCTDNMPSGTATKLGDVLSIRGGTTVEVLNTDAEGRLVMSDGLVLATEENPDAIVDMATLTGACLRALGPEIAGVFGNRQGMVDRVLAAADATDESAWPLPLAHRYRSELDSEVADISNMGGANGAAIHAALFLEEFVGGLPWAHVDIAGTAQATKAAGWLTTGCTGFGARLLAELALAFTSPANDPAADTPAGTAAIPSQTRSPESTTVSSGG